WPRRSGRHPGPGSARQSEQQWFAIRSMDTSTFDQGLLSQLVENIVQFLAKGFGNFAAQLRTRLACRPRCTRTYNCRDSTNQQHGLLSRGGIHPINSVELAGDILIQGCSRSLADKKRGQIYLLRSPISHRK
ncbi:hypothetical protein, partial [Stutzerimonas nitrititolerans]|uniref:hypothetical protein n=1 Tax=Stutzerimonas nitrititolerans TaxID=2482751 RepID=UPI0028B061FA